MGTIKPKELRRISDGVIFGYTDALAGMNGMVAVWPDGVNPNIEEPPSEGLRVESKDRQLRDVISDKSKQLVAMEKQVNDLYEENAKLNEEIAKLNRVIESMQAPKDVPDAVDVPTFTPVAPIGDRQTFVNLAVEQMYADNIPTDFTVTGKPRMESIEARSGIENVTSREREAAMKALGKDV